MGRCEFTKNASPDGISTEVCKREKKKKRKKEKSLERAPFVVSFVQTTRPPDRVLLSPAAPRVVRAPGAGRVLLQGVRRDPPPSSPQNSRPSPRACPPGEAALRETKAQGVRQERAPASTTTYRPQRTCACTQWTTALGVQAAGCRGCRDSHALPRGKFLPLGA